jgi:adenine-specific DNA-methyltransferase
MSINNLKNTVFKILKADDRIWNKEKNELNQTLLIDLLDKIDEKIIGILLENEEIRGKFFVKIKDIYVFKTNDFKFFLEENKINNSFTKYKNQIGLTDGKKFLKDSGDVVLDFPFKDCVLVGGQSTEEGEDKYFEYSNKAQKYEEKTAKRKEIFFNSVLAQDEIDRLFDEKALTGFKRFNKDGESEVKEIKRDANGTIKENLIIKGNNLLALHSLKSQFNGKVKLIYIDPPYNTGNDGFKYNDNFNHSSWLTFMKNRLEVAKDLLRDDGVIFVSIDDRESAYLKILCDEVFNRENFIGNIIWQHSIQAKNDNSRISLQHNSILVFAKGSKFKIGKIERTEEHNANYSNPDNDPMGRWRSGDVRSPSYSKSLIFDIETPSGKLIKSPEFGWRWNKERINQKIICGEIVFNKNETNIIRKIYLANQGGRVVESLWLAKDTGTTRIATKELIEVMGQKMFETPKPEKLLKRIIEIASSENDIVLDFFGGSGTTGAVAHKMNRQYILVEQMDYIKDLPEVRIRKVVEGEQGGISKSVNWQGGGDFIYFELAKHNETAKEKILNCQNLKELEALFDELYDKYFLNYNLKIKEFKEKVLKEDEFKNLELDDQKKMFLTMLDLNQMYVNKSEMADKSFAISQQDQELTKEFYKNEV